LAEKLRNESSEKSLLIVCLEAKLILHEALLQNIPLLFRGFGADFIWGAATSAYQIESASRRFGKGASVWDRFCRASGKIWEGQSGETACDHLRLLRKDVAWTRSLGLEAYRFFGFLTEGFATRTGKGGGLWIRLL